MKHVMHLIRLLLAGITVLELRWVHVGPAIARAAGDQARRASFEEIDAWRLELHKQLDAAAERRSRTMTA